MVGARGIPMARSNEELLTEVQRLRDEIAQLREMVAALYSVVFEEMGDEGPEDFPSREDDFSVYN